MQVEVQLYWNANSLICINFLVSVARAEEEKEKALGPWEENSFPFSKRGARLCGFMSPTRLSPRLSLSLSLILILPALAARLGVCARGSRRERANIQVVSWPKSPALSAIMAGRTRARQSNSRGSGRTTPALQGWRRKRGERGEKHPVRRRFSVQALGRSRRCSARCLG
jgi:hypothetical protein